MRPVGMGIVAAVVATTLVSCGNGGPGGSSETSDEGAVDGTVLDATCRGPCAPATDLRPFAGADASVLIEAKSSDQPSGEVAVDGGRFAAQLPPGEYRLSFSTSAGQCWSGGTSDAAIQASKTTRVQLEVENVCVASSGVGPGG